MIPMWAGVYNGVLLLGVLLQCNGWLHTHHGWNGKIMAGDLTLDELKKLWIDLSINDVIQLMLSGNTIDESASKTIKRMENQLNYFEQYPKLAFYLSL